MRRSIMFGAGALALAVLVVVGFLTLPKSESENTMMGQSIQQSTFQSIRSEVDAAQAYLYDVRTPEEFAAGHYPSATNFALQTMQAGTVPNLEKNTKIYVYCRSGNRSEQATRILQDAGYTNVVDLKGLDDVAAIGGTIVQ